jgi:hypothetical protein
VGLARGVLISNIILIYGSITINSGVSGTGVEVVIRNRTMIEIMCDVLNLLLAAFRRGIDHLERPQKLKK